MGIIMGEGLMLMYFWEEREKRLNQHCTADLQVRTERRVKD